MKVTTMRNGAHRRRAVSGARGSKGGEPTSVVGGRHRARPSREVGCHPATDLVLVRIRTAHESARCPLVLLVQATEQR